MPINHDNAHEYLPRLQELSRRVMELAREAESLRISYPKSDDFALMCLCFSRKQAEHLRSVATLIEAGLARDAELIVRSMVEGMAQLRWAAREPDRRPSMWRSYLVVEDYREMRRREAEGDVIDPELRRSVMRELGRVGSWHLKKSKGGRVKGDEYRNQWHGPSVRQMCEQALTADFYVYYGGLCQWAHWSPRGLGFALEQVGRDIAYTPSSPAASVRALFYACESALLSLYHLDNHLKLGYTVRVGQLLRELANWHKDAAGEDEPGITSATEGAAEETDPDQQNCAPE